MKVGEVYPHPVSFPNCSVELCASTLPLDTSMQSNKSDDGDTVESVESSNAPRSFTDECVAASTSQTSCKDAQ